MLQPTSQNLLKSSLESRLAICAVRLPVCILLRVQDLDFNFFLRRRSHHHDM